MQISLEGLRAAQTQHGSFIGPVMGTIPQFFEEHSGRKLSVSNKVLRRRELAMRAKLTADETADRRFGLNEPGTKTKPSTQPAPYNAEGCKKLLHAVKGTPDPAKIRAVKQAAPPDPEKVKAGRREIFRRALCKEASPADLALAQAAVEADRQRVISCRRQRAAKAAEIMASREAFKRDNPRSVGRSC